MQKDLTPDRLSCELALCSGKRQATFKNSLLVEECLSQHSMFLDYLLLN